MKVRRKTVLMDAWQFQGFDQPWPIGCPPAEPNGPRATGAMRVEGGSLIVRVRTRPAKVSAQGEVTMEGPERETWMPVAVGDWIIRGPAGFSVCRGGVFADSYEPAESER